MLDEAAVLIGRLRERGHTLALAESCTGGLIGAALTAVPGASEVFWGGLTSYDDAAKRALLGVSEATLRRYGAVSRAVAEEMAAGVRRVARSTWSIAVTGIAGPSGGTAEKPVGTVWIALDGPSSEARCHSFGDSRNEIREAAAVEAMRWLGSRVPLPGS
ncbi:CinA family protein [Candidatus Palauibacter sp.]|uniref:CinA family protein n=1 Tax=Candidatus Palauibacter sp. TaxID=3101350 RepID=UPI003B5CEEB0